MLCQRPVGETATERCALIQIVRSEDKSTSNLGLIIEKPPELNATTLRVVAPLSVYLLNGVSLKIDQTDIGRAAFVRCAPAGCLADIPIDGKLLEQLKGGKIATLVIYLEPDEGLRHLFRLEGFKEGYERFGKEVPRALHPEPVECHVNITGESFLPSLLLTRRGERHDRSATGLLDGGISNCEW